MGNGQGSYINATGSSKLFSTTQPHVTLSLNDLLLVPSITENLMSVSKFAKDNHVYFVFYSNCCYVKCQESDKVLLQGVVGPDGLYRFQQLQFTHQPSSKSTPVVLTCSSQATSHTPINTHSLNTSNTHSTFDTWDKRLGHANNNSVSCSYSL